MNEPENHYKQKMHERKVLVVKHTTQEREINDVRV